MSKNIRALPSLLRLSLGSDVPHPDTTGKVPPSSPVATPLPAAAELARVLGLPLDQLDRVLTVRVPWWPEPLWFVPGPEDVEGLVAVGVSRGAVWTRRELLDLFSIPTITKDGARRIAEAKLAMAGEVVEVRERELAKARQAATQAKPGESA